MLKPTVDGASVRRAISLLKDLDVNAQKNLAKEMRGALGTYAQTIAHDVPTTAPLSGMGRDLGRLRWGQVRKPTVSLTPGKSRGGMKALVSIRINVNPEAGYKMAELAGSKMRITQKRGEIMIRRLEERFPYKGKAGRFAFKRFRSVRPEIIEEAIKIFDKYFEIVNRSF